MDNKDIAKILNEANTKDFEDILKMFRTIVNSVRDALVMMDSAGRISYWNRAAENIFGYAREEVLGLSLQKLLAPRGNQEVHKGISVAFQGENIEELIEVQVITKSGKEIVVELSQISVEFKGGWYFFNIIKDITERKRAEETLQESEKRYRELSIIDDRTQLYNSRHFHTQLEIEVERSNRYEQPLTLLMLDIDNFKRFNDTYGHVEGDNVISRLGQVLKRCLREIDSAYRYGGEEFTIMLPMTTSEKGIVTAKRIQTELRKEAFSPVLGQEIYMTVSIGLSQYKPKEEMKAFVHRVDQIMYQAKKEGRDRICS